MPKKDPETEPENEEMISPSDEQPAEIPARLPLLPIRDVVVFPYMILPLFVGREMSIRAIDGALSESRMVLLAAQKDLSVENPEPKDIYAVGTVLYEMLVGEKLFEGETVSDTLAGVLRAEIDFARLPPATPLALRQLLP